MPLQFGSSAVSAVKFGGNAVQAVYFGSTQVWSACNYTYYEVGPCVDCDTTLWFAENSCGGGFYYNAAKDMNGPYYGECTCGCIDSGACDYNSEADIPTECGGGYVGCTDANATNYDPGASCASNASGAATCCYDFGQTQESSDGCGSCGFASYRVDLIDSCGNAFDYYYTEYPDSNCDCSE